MSRVRYILFLIIVFFIQKTDAQQLYVSPEEYIDGNTGKVNVIGNLGDTTISFLESYKGFKLIWHDSIMRKLGVSDLDFLERGGEEFRFFTGDNAVFIFYQKKKRKHLELWAAKAIPTDKDTIRPILIDSVELSGVWDKTRYIIHNTQSPNRFAYSFTNYNNNEGKLEVKASLLNEKLNTLQQVDEQITEIAYYETLQILADAQDGLHILFGQAGQRPGRFQSILMGSKRLGQSKMVYKKLDNSNYSLGGAQMIFNNSNNEIVLGGVAYDKNAKQLSALARCIYKPEIQQWESMLYTKIDNVQNATNNDLTNLHLQKFFIREDGGCAFVLEKVFEEVYERNRSIGFISPGMSMASSSYSVYHKDELYVYNTTATGEVQWGTVVPKSQETGDANERFHSFGVVEYPLGSIFLYQDQSNKSDRFITAFLSNTGKLTLRQFQSTSYSSIEEDGLMLRDAKQVSANAVVFPIVKRGTLSFAKIVF